MIRGGNCQQVFREVDVTKDGRITKLELKNAIKDMGFNWVDDAVVLAVMDKLDVDKSGDITLDEL